MIKTQMRLEEWQYDALKRLSRESSRSVADLVRESVSELVRRTEAGALLPLEEISGRYSPLDLKDIKNHDRSWTDAIRAEPRSSGPTWR